MSEVVAEPVAQARGEAPPLQRRLGNRAAGRMLTDGALRPGAGLPGALGGAIEAARGRGRAVDAGAASRVGEILGADLRGVQVHDDAGADALCEGLAARAFTSGGDIFFARGSYDPGSPRGGAILAHELTHVVQQGGRRGGGPLRLGAPDSAHERAAELVARGEPVAGGVGRASAGEVMRLAVTAPVPTTLAVTRGGLTRLGEGSDSQTKYIHWPNTAASGVTLGKGYDIGNRTTQQVKDELTAAGMSLDQATKISAGATLKGADAEAFVSEHKTEIGEIDKDVQSELLDTLMVEYGEKAKSTATSTVADATNRNAAGREAKEGKPAGTYVLTEAQWTGLHPAMVELLTDLIYQGGYYGWDRVAKINEKLIAHDGDQLEQFKSVRELFTGDYMDTYASTIGEGMAAAGATEALYGKTVATGGKYRRNQIRLAYLDHVIEALEAGKTVTVEAGTASAAAGTAATTHVVQPDETLAKIAAKYGISVEALKAANAGKLKTWGTVQGFEAGETVTIPGVGGAPAATPAAASAPAVPAGPDYMALARTIYEAMQGMTLAAMLPALLTALAAARAAKNGVAELRKAFATLYHLDLVGEVRRRVEESWFGGLAETVMSYFVEDEAAAPAAAPVAAPTATVVSAPILGSVGAGGKNQARDVKIVQANLIALGYLSPGPEVTQALGMADDAVVSGLTQTIAAIKQYQKFGLGAQTQDGRVDVNGGTWTQMAGRLQMIQDHAGQVVATTAIAAVMSSSEWVSQFESDTDKNGDGRGLAESEKAYPGKANIKCCWDAAQVMVTAKGGSLKHEVTSRIPTLLQQGGETRGLGRQAELGVKYIDEQLLAGKPVMIGVDDGRIEVYNDDATTEHYVVIVGKVITDGKVYYRYFDPGTRWGSKGYSADNLLLLGADFGLSGKSYSGEKTYRMAQVRQYG